MKKLAAFTFTVVAALMAGCVSFNYGSSFTQQMPRADLATLVIYRHDTATLAPVGKAPLPYEIDGVPGEEMLNPHSFKVLTVPAGKKVMNARTGLIDLRREATLENGKIYYAKASCYYVVTEAFCKIELVPDSTGLQEIAGLRESNGTASK